MKMNQKCGKLWKKVNNLKRLYLCMNVDNFGKLFIKWGLCLFFIVEIWVNMLSNVSAATEEEIQEPDGLYAQSAVLMDADSGRILFAKNGQEERAMASTTKIMTCILALENGNLDDTVTVSANAAAQPEVHLGVQEGEEFRLRDLLYSLMLESHNDAAVAIAEHIGTSVEGFADMMNEKARQAGCSQTHFVTPNGLDDSDEEGSHHTTAEDLARIMKYCIMDSPQQKAFLEITRTENYSFTNLSGSRSFSCYNHNAFLTMMDGALSGKTGFTGEAGYCYVGALRRDDRTFIVSLLACGWPNNKGYKWADTKKLMTYGIDHFHYQNVFQEVDPGTIPVLDGIPDENHLNGEASVHTVVDTKPKMQKQAEEGAAEDEAEPPGSPGKKILLRDDDEVAVDVEKEESLKAPVSKGEPAGEVLYRLGEEVLFTQQIVTDEAVERRDLPWCVEKIGNIFFVAG